MSDIRYQALALAHDPVQKSSAVIERANAYLAFLSGGAEPAKPDTGKPPAAEPVDVRPTQDGSTSQSADAVSALEAEQPAEDVPDAAPDTADAPSKVDLTKVQAAVLAVNRLKGRDTVVSILGQFGGAKLPEVPTDQHPFLFAALNAVLEPKDRIEA